MVVYAVVVGVAAVDPPALSTLVVVARVEVEVVVVVLVPGTAIAAPLPDGL